MKNSLRYLSGVATVAAALTISPLAFAQTAVTTTTADGTISEFSPEGTSIVVHSDAAPEPLRYTYSKSTTIVDDEGNPVDVSVVRSGVPVQVYYDRDGDTRVARKIVVRRRHHVVTEAPAATTTTTVAVPATTTVAVPATTTVAPAAIERKETTTTTTTTNK